MPDCGIFTIGDLSPLFFDPCIMLDKNYIRELIEQKTAGTDFFLVDLSITRSNLIQVYLDHPGGISLDDCVRFSREIEQSLDRESEDFELQVSSPGLGQPFKVFGQYKNAVGEKLEIILDTDERIRGKLIEASPAGIESPARILVQPFGTKKKPSPSDPVEIHLNNIKIARIELDF